MSMAIQRAKYTGDPGFFDFFKKAVSFVPGVGAPISSALGLFGRQPARPTAGPGGFDFSRFRDPSGCKPGSTYNKMLDICVPTGMGITNGQMPAPGIGSALQRFFPGGQTGLMAAPTGAMNGTAGGYHLNKSDYFLKSGEYVAAETRWVKNRKRNPANARATSRAISRVVGAKRYAKSLSRISVRKSCKT